MNLPELTPRERIVLIAGAAVLLVLLLVFGVLLPYRAALARLDARIAARETQLQEMRGLRQEYLLLQQQVTAAESRLEKTQGFSLFSFVEAAAARVAGKENLVYMRPQTAPGQAGFREETVELKLERLRLDQLIRFLYAVESADAYLQVKNLRVRTRFDNKSQLDAVMTISLYGRSK